LGTREPNVDELVRFLQGEDTLRTGGDFMGRKWLVPSVPLWREVFRVLKPGAYLAAFSGTRAVDLIMMGIRAAGFEIVDCCSYLYGAGFPKSVNASKAIDKHFGAVREVVGERPARLLFGHLDVGSATIPTTIPTTPQAQQWDGFGTALKPAHEDIIIAIKPREGTIAANLLKHGTGVLNVDGCRVGTDWSERSDAWKRSGHSAKPDADKIAAPAGQGIVCNPAGRWPPNVLFGHADGCVRVGSRKARGGAGTDCPHWPDPCRGHGDAGQCQSGETRHGSPPAGWTPNRTETVDNYDCAPGCPVRLLDEQSGETISRPSVRGGSDGYHPATPLGRTDNFSPFNDSGTASRFFPTFQYSAKSSRLEREIGCEALPVRSRTDATGRDDDAPGQNNPRAGLRAAGGIRNAHPCVKPVDVLRWITRLVTPPGGIVLDPFCGSGSGGCAAVAEGFRYAGIDLDADGLGYCDVARARIAWWQAHPGGPTPEAKEETQLEAAGQRSLFG